MQEWDVRREEEKERAIVQHHRVVMCPQCYGASEGDMGSFNADSSHLPAALLSKSETYPELHPQSVTRG